MPANGELEQKIGLSTLALSSEWNQKWLSKYEALGFLTRDNFFRELGQFTNQLFKESAAFTPQRNILGPGRVKHVVDAVTATHFNTIDAMGETDQYKTVLRVARNLEELKRQIILEQLDRGDNLGFTEEEGIVVRGYLSMVGTFDDIAEHWRNDIVWSDIGRKMDSLSDNDKVKLPETLQKLNLAHSYGILRTGEGADFDALVRGESGRGFSEVCQMEAYSSDYQKLSLVLADTIQKLDGLPSSFKRDPYIVYFRAWKDLCDCRDLNEANKLSEALDSAWMDLPDDLLVTHNMEYGYYGADGIRKDMVTRIDLMDSQKAELIKKCNEQRDKVRTYLEGDPRTLNLPVLRGSLNSLRHTRFLALVPITRTMGYDFNTAGESLPNSDHQRVTDKKGKRVLVFREGCNISWERRKKEWNTYFGGSEFDTAIDEFTVDDWITFCLATHESGETASRDAKTEERLGNKLVSDINENKADSAGVSYLGAEAQIGELNDEDCIKLAKLELASSIFFLSRWGSLQVEPYYKNGVITINLAVACGLFIEKEGHWIPDFSKSRDFLISLTDHFWKKQAPIWESATPEEARRRKALSLDSLLEETSAVQAILGVTSERYRSTHN